MMRNSAVRSLMLRHWWQALLEMLLTDRWLSGWMTLRPGKGREWRWVERTNSFGSVSWNLIASKPALPSPH